MRTTARKNKNKRKTKTKAFKPVRASKKGAFSKKASKKKMSAQEYADYLAIKKNQTGVSKETLLQANFVRVSRKWARSKKK